MSYKILLEFLGWSDFVRLLNFDQGALETPSGENHVIRVVKL